MKKKFFKFDAKLRVQRADNYWFGNGCTKGPFYMGLSRINGASQKNTAIISFIVNGMAFLKPLRNQKSVKGCGRGGGRRKIIGIRHVCFLHLILRSHA